MVGLVSNSHLTSTESKPKKMCDSSEVVDENMETEKKEVPVTKIEDAPAVDLMDVDENQCTSTLSEEPSKEETKDNNDKSARRKSRSSRSQSTNSSSSANVNPPEEKEKEKEKEKTTTKSETHNSEEEDFFGFELMESEKTKVESSIDQYKKARMANSQNTELPEPTAGDTTKDKTVNNEGSPDKAESGSVDMDLSAGFETPSTSVKKTSRAPKKTPSIDLSNPEFRKPFEFGWVRELVYRSTTDNSLRRNADIYYYTPTGKKVRSSREILDHLTGELTLENFTFFKGSIGIDDPSKEIIREAKTKPGPRGHEDGLTPAIKKTTPKAKIQTQSSSPKEPLKVITPKVVFRGNTTPKSRPPPAKSKLDKKRKSAGPDDVDVMVESEDWSPEVPKVNIQSSGSQCSIRCPLALGLIPTLQCATCLCLYHPACMAVSEEKMNKPSFVFKCKICKSKPPKVEATPRDLPLQAKSTNESSTTTLTPSIVKASSQSSQPSVPVPLSSTRPGIVGAMTTWFSPSSSIQQGNVPTEVDENTPGIYVNPKGATFIGFSRNTVVNVNTQEPAEVNTATNSTGLYLIPCDPQHHNGPQYVPLANGLKRPLDSPTEKEKDASPPEKKSKHESKVRAEKEERTDNDQSDNEFDEESERDLEKDFELIGSQFSKGAIAPHNFMMNLNAGFIALLHAFQYLRVYELLRAGHVSKMWQFVASHHSLWETVRMKNSRVSDWKGFGRTLSSRGTKCLDLRKMLVPESPEEQAKMWEELCKAVEGIKTLTKVDMGRCSPAAFIAMAEAAPQLESLVSLAINWKEKNAVHTAGSRKRGNEIDLLPLAKCKNLKELRIKTVTGTLEIKDLSVLSKLTNLTTLGLTTIKNLKGIENYLPVNITSLELGECSLLSKDVASIALPTLVNLKRLRLEKGQGECPTIALLEAISTLPQLTQLELINFDIKPGFDRALAKCTNLRTLLIIPTYVTQSATTNHVVMGGVAKLSRTLTYFIWGLTLELLKVTDLFIGQVENQKTGKAGGPTPQKKGAGDSIPILKPSTAAVEGGELKEGSQAPSQVDILALPNLQRVLSTLLPTTKIKILKVPFSATWRQTVSDN